METVELEKGFPLTVVQSCLPPCLHVEQPLTKSGIGVLCANSNTWGKGDFDLIVLGTCLLDGQGNLTFCLIFSYPIGKKNLKNTELTSLPRALFD